MTEYKLTYFNGMGLGEGVRLLFHYMGLPFTDNRIKAEEWAEMKKKTPWGKLPMLEVNGKIVCQSGSICRYLGKMANLAGKDNWEALQIDMVVDCAQDMRLEFSAYYREPDESRKAQKKETLFKETIPHYFGKLDQQIKDNKGYLVNGQLSWGDIVVASYLQMLNAVAKTDLTEPYANLHAWLDKFVNHPKLKDYIASRPKSDF